MEFSNQVNIAGISVFLASYYFTDLKTAFLITLAHALAHMIAAKL